MDTEQTEQRVHHPYSPSTLQSREWCPCYENSQADTPHERTTAGTRAHGVVETGEDDQRLSDEDAVAAAECLDFVFQRQQLMQEDADRARIKAATANDGPEGIFTEDELLALFSVTELKETYLPVDGLHFSDCESTTAGYVDRVLLNYDKTYAEMFDWKFGLWAVEGTESNLQGIAYTLGLFRMFPTLRKIRFYFKQPHLDAVDAADFTREQIPALYLRVQTVVARAREAKRLGDFSMANPGMPICSFCANLGKCEKVCEFACKVGRKFHPLGIPENITPSLLQEPGQTALGLQLAAVLKVWCDAFRRQVSERVIRGEAEMPAGYKIQELSKRELVDMVKLRATALRYLTEAEFITTLECTFGSVETLISEKAPRGQKKSTVEEFKQALLDCNAVKMGDSFSFLRAIPQKG